jgi:DNA-binding response OmpR family regulator
MKHLLLVEDDLSLIGGLRFALEKQGYELTVARTTREAETQWRGGNYDLVILDVSLPDGSGYDLCREIRRTSRVPVLFLTAADEETDIIMGLDIGGDDYMTKPFKLAVFLSRVNALLRRGDHFSQADAELHSNGFCVKLLQGEARKNGILLDLTASEYKLLCLFMRSPNQVLSPEQILGSLWDSDGNYIDNNTLTVYIRRLRMKIEDDPAAPRYLLTVRRMGYKWNTGERDSL